MSKIEVDTIEPQSGTTVTLGASGDTFSVPSGAILGGAGTFNLSSGTVTLNSSMKNTPAFAAFVASNRGPFSQGILTDIPFESEKFDTDNAFDGTTFTVPETGKYYFSCCVRVEGLVVDTYYQIRITTGTTAVATIGTNGFNDTTPFFMLNNSIISSESAGSTIKVQIYQSGTGTSYVHTESYFCGMKLIGA